MKERFLEEYSIIRINPNSMLVQNKTTLNKVFIHRNTFNTLDEAQEYRERERTIVDKNGEEKTSVWIETLVWKHI